MPGRLLQVLPSVLTTINHELQAEVDFCEGLRLCLENFDEVRIACPVTTDIKNSGLRRTRPVADLPHQNRFEFIPLPNAYGWREFRKFYHPVRRRLNLEIQKADYLVFSPHALIGDWPTVAAREAASLHRPYVLDADVVYEKVAPVGWARDASWKRAIKQNVMLPLFQRSHRKTLGAADLALLQGQDVFDSYSPFTKNAHKVYHMPVSGDDYISQQQLHDKLNGLAGRPLRVSYVGRAIDMKGPMDWIRTLQELSDRGIKVDATWLGDGELLPEMRARANALKIDFAGYVSDRGMILETLRESDMLLFCHITPESPRCLVEALASGCPLIGYGSSYPREIVAQSGGGQFVEVGDWRGLADLVTSLDKDREQLRKLILAASVSGSLYERDATMQRRIDLIKQYTTPEYLAARLV